MNQTKSRMTDVMVHSVPLFASSWVALFSLIRNNLGKERDDADPQLEGDRFEAT